MLPDVRVERERDGWRAIGQWLASGAWHEWFALARLTPLAALATRFVRAFSVEQPESLYPHPCNWLPAISPVIMHGADSAVNLSEPRWLA